MTNFRRTWCAVAFIASMFTMSASAVELDLCARGLSQNPLQPFTKTIHAKVSLGAVAVDEPLARSLAAELIRTTIWQGKADQVFVESYGEAACGASQGQEVILTSDLSEAEASQARASQEQRGTLDLKAMAAVARRAVMSVTPELDIGKRRAWLRIFYATNRKTKPGGVTLSTFGPERSDELSYGVVEVAVTRHDDMRDVQSPAVVRVEGLSDVAVAPTVSPLTLDAWRAELRKAALPFEKPGILVFIHGFDVSFSDAAQRAGQLAYDLAFPGPVVFFAWPSDASLVKYLNDGRDAENSVPATATVLQEVAALLPDGPVYVIAHSMGNRLLTGGYVRLREDSPDRQRAFREMVLAAPDMDQDDFQLNFARSLLTGRGPRFTLYASQHDLALGVSATLAGGRRLGSGGPDLYTHAGLDSIDASSISNAFFSFNHSYFGDTSTVLADLFYLIRNHLPPPQRPHLHRRDKADGSSAWEFAGSP